MRPQDLYAYFAATESLPGIGPKNRQLLEKLAGGRVRDLLFHLPVSVIDRAYRPSIEDAQPGRIATFDVAVIQHTKGAQRRAPYRVTVADDSGSLTLVFFSAREAWLKQHLPLGERRLISGKLEVWQGQKQMTHPDYILPPSEAEDMPLIEPIYALTAGLAGKTVRKATAAALESVAALPEWLDGPLMQREGWPDFKAALRLVHNPQNAEAISPESPARQRLAVDELLASQLALALSRYTQRKKRGRMLSGDGHLRAAIMRALPYALTADQKQAVDEIIADMQAPEAMLRLLQGDVGSGKTVVALLAAAHAAEAGVQTALLAPTEILALQHFDSLQETALRAGLQVDLLTGRHRGKAREGKLMALATGETDIMVGTHALLEDSVVFRDLGLAIADEQHRFGVEQRARLARKSPGGVDLLGMTATPIPRSLRLAAYGDMDVSRIREKPPGRLPIKTVVISQSRLEEVAHALSRALGAGNRAFWVCPLVEESAVSDAAAAEERFDWLNSLFPGRVGLIHGRMKSAEKDAVMADFQSGKIGLLVATTVIEVGVNVPEATIMVVDQAERFGLAQLHQLRGRVGRGQAASTCLLLRAEHLGEAAAKRLAVMRETEDGFVIAEEDLRLRGGGDLLGTRQTGLPDFRLADLDHHTELLTLAQDDARRVVMIDPELQTERGQALRRLLYLFERDEGIRLMKSG